jgi:hypothetical protein
MMHSPSSACETHAMGAAPIVKDVASVLRGLARRRSEVPRTMLISRGVFEHQATSSRMMAKPTLASGWRTIASCVEWAERTMNSLSSSSSHSI